MKNNFFKGDDGLYEYLQPKKDKMIPLVELPESLNPFLKYDIHIAAKLMNTLPLMNVKSLPAWNMLDGINNHDHEDLCIVESSSGNTVVSMGLLKDHFGIKKVKAIASTSVSDDKLAFLRLAGLDIECVESPICPDPRDPNGPINIAKKQGENKGWTNPNQYNNILNPAIHYEVTGPQIESQVGKDLAFFSAGLGTTGTFTGTVSYLLSKYPDLNVIGAVRKPNNPIPGVRTRSQLAEIDFNWQEHIKKDDVFKISEKKSYLNSLKMIRKGLLVGPSSGFALSALLEKLHIMEKTGEIMKYKGKYAVFVCPDSPLLYVNDYEKILEPEYFGETTGIDLRQKNKIDTQVNLNNDFNEITADELLDKMNEGVFEIVDVRNKEEFAEYHLEGSINVPLYSLESRLNELNTEKTTVFVCNRGVTSGRACIVAHDAGFSNVISLEGGMINWSSLDYPRYKNGTCLNIRKYNDEIDT